MMLKLLELVNIGTLCENEPLCAYTSQHRRRILVTNFISIVIGIIGWVFVPILATSGFPRLALYASLTGSGYVASLIFNARHYHTAASTFLILWFNYWVYFYGNQLPHFNFSHLFFFMSSILPLCLFQLSQLRLILALTAIPTLLMVIQAHTQSMVIVTAIKNSSPIDTTPPMLSVAIMLTGVFLNFIGVFYFKWASESAMRSKSAFLANMSHEIRTPLWGMLGMAELLQHQTNISDDTREQINTIVDCGQSLLAVLNDVLDLSKMEAGKMTVHYHVFNLHRMIRSIASLFDAQAMSKSVDLVLDIQRDIPLYIKSDQQRLRQVISNLLGNALKFTTSGTVTVCVSNEPTACGSSGGGGDRNKNMLRIDVIDTGIGISKEHQARIFDAFSQADASTTRIFGGSGLGLCISQKIVHLLGGRMELQSQPGIGSKFSFIVPYDEVDTSKSQKPVTSPTSADEQNSVVDATKTTTTTTMTSTTTTRATATTTEAAAAVAAEEEEKKKKKKFKRKKKPSRVTTSMGKVAATPPLAVTGLVRSSSSSIVDADVASPVMSPIVRPISLTERRNKRVNTPAPKLSHRPVDESLRVLVAEDNLVNQKLLGRMLKQLHTDPEFCVNGIEAVAKVRENEPTDGDDDNDDDDDENSNGNSSGNKRQQFDVIFMDVQMPEMDGKEACAIIRALRLAKQPYIVGLTAHAFHSDRESCLKSGMDDFATKPATLQTLREKLEHVLSARRAGENPSSLSLLSASSASSSTE